MNLSPYLIEFDVNCYTDGSKMNELAGAGIAVKSNPNSVNLEHREAFHLGQEVVALLRGWGVQACHFGKNDFEL